MIPKNKIIIPVHEPDGKEKFFFFISGIIISVPFTILFESLGASLSSFTSNFIASLLSITIIAPLVEEFAKAYPLFYRHGETSKSIFVLGLLVGLGFGISEFFVYIFIYNANVIVRIPAIFFHAASTSITAYGVATKRSMNFYIIAVLLHSFTNFFAVLGNIWFLIGGILAIWATYFISINLYKKVSK
jgi:RsiW-degrading membrane proteinase PrsW (M82 family)